MAKLVVQFWASAKYWNILVALRGMTDWKKMTLDGIVAGKIRRGKPRLRRTSQMFSEWWQRHVDRTAEERHQCHSKQICPQQDKQTEEESCRFAIRQWIWLENFAWVSYYTPFHFSIMNKVQSVVLLQQKSYVPCCYGYKNNAQIKYMSAVSQQT